MHPLLNSKNKTLFALNPFIYLQKILYSHYLNRRISRSSYTSTLWKLNFRELYNRLGKALRNSSCKNLVKKSQWHKSLKWSKNLLILPHQMGPRSILPSVLLVSENYQWLWETVFGQVETDFMAHNSCQQKKEVWAVLIELLTLELTITLLVERRGRGVRWFFILCSDLLLDIIHFKFEKEKTGKSFAIFWKLALRGNKARDEAVFTI